MYASFQLKVDAGNHDRHYCPVRIAIAKDTVLLGDGEIEQLSMRDDNGKEIQIQWSEEGNNYILQWMIQNLPAKGCRTYLISNEQRLTVNDTGVQLVEGDNKIDVKIDGDYFTSYIYDPTVAKPYMGPIIGPNGGSYTRLDLETNEHPHQRSLWLAIGDVNGSDMWNEPTGGYGKQIHQNFSEVVSGPVCARITAHNVWVNAKGKPQIDENRTIIIYNTPSEGRFIDIEITFQANYGQVEFGATKEAGPLGIRLAESMNVCNGGTMINSYGSIGEKECWGRRAEWCDYFGKVGGNTLGIAAFDHPSNEHHPTYWHIRDYGLLAPNNFYFIGGRLIKPNEIVRFIYRIYFHNGDTEKAMVADRYQDYIHPPKIERL